MDNDDDGNGCDHDGVMDQISRRCKNVNGVGFVF